jgi:hypothetical protein
MIYKCLAALRWIYKFWTWKPSEEQEDMIKVFLGSILTLICMIAFALIVAFAPIVLLILFIIAIILALIKFIQIRERQ